MGTGWIATIFQERAPPACTATRGFPVFARPVRLQHGSSLNRPHHKGEDCENEEDHEQDLRDRGGCAGDPAEAEGGRNKGKDKEDKRPTEHGVLLNKNCVVRIINAACICRFRSVPGWNLVSAPAL